MAWLPFVRTWTKPNDSITLALDGDLARAEPKTLRYKILHAAARLTHSGRRRRLKISRTWPWATVITTAWTRLSALPQAP